MADILDEEAYSRREAAGVRSPGGENEYTRGEKDHRAAGRYAEKSVVS
jgi:hypothetical protein